MKSAKEKFLELPLEEREKRLSQISDMEAEQLLYDWSFTGRPKQQAPEGDWRIWLIMAGRGYGKTRTGAEWVRQKVEAGAKRIAIVTPTSADARDVAVEGESGIISISPPWNKPHYEPSKRRVTWPNGAIATLYSAEEPERLRGPQHDAAWCLSGDTMITTDKGTVRLDKITPQHKAYTPWGYKRIYNVVLTNPAAKTHTFRHTNGIIRATKDHLVYSSGKFKPLGDSPCVTYVRSIKEKCITSDQTGATNLEGSVWLEWSTLMRLAKYLPYMRSIIRIITARMIQWRIWNCSLQKSTTKNTQNNDVQKYAIDTLAHQKLNTPALTAKNNSLENNGQEINLQDSALLTVLTHGVVHPLLALKSVIAKYARLHTWLNDHIKNIVVRNVTHKQVESEEHLYIQSKVEHVEEYPNLEPVYDLGVEGGVFIANGVITHNCDEIAAWSYLQETWDMLQFGLRLGKNPQTVLTSTPKPSKLLFKMVKDSQNPANRIVITQGSSYENKSNLAKPFFDQIVQYEGTTLGRQEIHAELIDMAESGIIKKSWFKWWTNDKAKTPQFQYIIQSYDTAFTEKTHNDPTACTVWGVFRPDNESPHCVMLLDAWQEHLKYPDLRDRVQEEYLQSRYGTNEQHADIVLIEDKGSGITLRQDLSRAGVPVRAYNPKNDDKVTRVHAISHLVANGRVYLPESKKVKNEIVTWGQDFIEQLSAFPTKGEHDDYVDTFSQALALLRDQNWLVLQQDVVEDDFEEDYYEKKKSNVNPYSM